MERKSLPIRGRGATINPVGRFEKLDVEPDDEHRDPEEEPSHPATLYLRDSSRSALTSNDSPDVGFNYSLNPYRGCSHGCSYCESGDTAVLMADGSTRELASLRPGDEIIGTSLGGSPRHYRRTLVLAHWATRKPAFRVVLEDGTELVASGDHRFLTDRGWKHVANIAGSRQRRHLRLEDNLMGFGALRGTPVIGSVDEYQRGYLCGILGDLGHARTQVHRRERGRTALSFQLMLATADGEALTRTATYLSRYGVATTPFLSQQATTARREVRAIRANTRASLDRLHELIAWPASFVVDWARGFLAGLFDAHGTFGDHVLRITATDERTVRRAAECLRQLGFAFVRETQVRAAKRAVHAVSITGGLPHHLRFFSWMTPAIRRKRDLEGQVVRSHGRLTVVAIEPLGREIEMWDITTGTGDFIANGVISHNCYARPTHEYLGFSAGLDFETRIMVKENAPELLRAELASRRWKPQIVMLSGVTDCYQPIERKLRITRRCLEVLAEARNPVGVITKNHLVTRDVDLLAELAQFDACSVHLSIPTIDPDLARVLEPRASTPKRRLQAIETLAKAGVPVGVMVAPVIPGLTDHEIPQILEGAASAGARTAGWVVLRLPHGVKDIFEDWLRTHRPERAERVLARVRDMREGRLYDSTFGVRARGTGNYADQIATLFEVARRRVGFSDRSYELSTAAFRPPAAGPQMSLF